MVKPLVSICAWCPDKAAKTKAAEDAGHAVTHGICAACIVKWEKA